MKLHERLDRIEERLASIDKTLAVNTESLMIHIKRTNLLEESLKPVEQHVARVDGALRFLGVISLVVGIIAALYKMFA